MNESVAAFLHAKNCAKELVEIVEMLLLFWKGNCWVGSLKRGFLWLVCREHLRIVAVACYQKAQSSTSQRQASSFSEPTLITVAFSISVDDVLPGWKKSRGYFPKPPSTAALLNRVTHLHTVTSHQLCKMHLVSMETVLIGCHLSVCVRKCVCFSSAGHRVSPQ